MPDIERFEALVAALLDLDAALSPIGAAVLTACHMGVADDSRSAANRLGLAHALVLRELHALDERAILTISRRDTRVMRTFYAISEKGARLLHRTGR